mgnify:CR=1 FL=1
MKKFFDITFWKFIIVGIVNTVFGTAIMFIFYNCFSLNYWISSAANYFFGSILSYFLNKHFTFKNTEKGWKPLIKFTVNVLTCYLIAYGVAKPIVSYFLQTQSKSIQENGAMFVGMCLFVGLNYIGQRFFAFKPKDDSY